MKKSISLNQQLLFKNVISKYYFPKSDEISQSFTEFLESIQEMGFKKSGPFFYSINSDYREDRTIIIECFIPVEENNIKDLPGDFKYNSYFQVLNLATTRAFGTDERAITESVYFLSKYLKRNNIKEITPPFYLVTVHDDKVYTDIMVGTRREF